MMWSVNVNMILFEKTEDLVFVQRELHRVFCKDLADLVLEFLQPEIEAWDPWSWSLDVPEHSLDVPEFDSYGNYCSLPMCPTDLPLF